MYNAESFMEDRLYNKNVTNFFKIFFMMLKKKAAQMYLTCDCGPKTAKRTKELFKNFVD